MIRKRIIVITDGDEVAQQAVRLAGKKLGLRVISRSGGNPTPLEGAEIAALIKKAPFDPVLVMVDDRGRRYQGQGERALAYLAADPEIEILGVLAVAANTEGAQGTAVSFSIDNRGEVVAGAVDKDGHEVGNPTLKGDTVDVLNEIQVPLIVGIGDVGKNGGRDAIRRGVPITVRAIREILRHHRV
ncbi:MAG: stage V sporulation protein AE [Firmicutes bacterium]|nr:stage V sporulation protein AE [Bacillota bacterium]MCL5038385.1 stage V sporulation protein AE [Bacillota bacterium]